MRAGWRSGVQDAVRLRNGERAFLLFDGVGSACYVYLNGELLGYSQDSRLPIEFEVTAHLRDGENHLLVQVMRWCDGSYLEDQDHWWLSGIHRDVWLYRKPAAHLADLEAAITLEDDATQPNGFASTLRIRAHVRLPA